MFGCSTCMLRGVDPTLPFLIPHCPQCGAVMEKLDCPACGRDLPPAGVLGGGFCFGCGGPIADLCARWTQLLVPPVAVRAPRPAPDLEEDHREPVAQLPEPEEPAADNPERPVFDWIGEPMGTRE